MIQILDARARRSMPKTEQLMAVSRTGGATLAVISQALANELGWTDKDSIVFGKELPNWYIGRTSKVFGIPIHAKMDGSNRLTFNAKSILEELIATRGAEFVNGKCYFRFEETTLKVGDMPYFWYKLKPLKAKDL